MSGAVYVAAAAAVAATAASTYSANKQAKAQEKATKRAEKEAEDTATQARMDMRRQNAREADVSGILDANQNAGLSGGSTLLSGASGVGKGDVTLGSAGTLG